MFQKQRLIYCYKMDSGKQPLGDVRNEKSVSTVGYKEDGYQYWSNNNANQQKGRKNIYDLSSHELAVRSLLHDMTIDSEHHDWTVMDLYSYALNLDDVNDIYDLKGKKIIKRSYPPSLDPFDEIVFFIRNNGPQLWARSDDLIYVFEWLYKNNKLKLMRHPVTGDTIFHKNPRLVDELHLNREILVLVNYRGQTVALRKWFQENDMPAIEIK